MKRNIEKLGLLSPLTTPVKRDEHERDTDFRVNPNLELCLQKFNSFKESSHPSSRMNQVREQVDIPDLIKKIATQRVLQVPKPKLTIGSSSKKAIL